MPNPRLASRYAKSILDLSQETNQADVILNDMKYIGAVAQESREFALFLQSPIIKADKKVAAFDAIFNGKVSDLTIQFVHLLINKGREKNLVEITQAFQNQYNNQKNIQEVAITTAVPMNEEVRKQVIAKASSLVPGKTIEAKEIINPEIIGGFIIEIGDKLFDASVKNELNKIKKQFTSNLYIPQV